MGLKKPRSTIFVKKTPHFSGVSIHCKWKHFEKQRQNLLTTYQLPGEKEQPKAVLKQPGDIEEPTVLSSSSCLLCSSLLSSAAQ